MKIIPAIDIFNNKTVRLSQGNYENITYYSLEPLQQAKLFEKSGFNRIHIVDLQGSARGEITVLEILKSIKSETGLEIEFGGGIRNINTVELLLKNGIDKIIIGSMAVVDKENFENIIHSFDPNSFIISADVNNLMIAIQGWLKTSSISLSDHINYCLSLGLDQFVCTDISKDGMLIGTNNSLYATIMKDFPKIKLIASGGIRDIEDVKAIKKMGLHGVIVGKAIYENKINLEELKSVAD